MKRISWKPGMRLSANILKASDECMANLVANAFVLSAVGRFGLLPSQRPFDVRLIVGEDTLEIASLYCMAVTREGDLIDVQFDTSYNHNYVTKIPIPDVSGVTKYILSINAVRGEWNEVPGNYEEPSYTFSLYQVNEADQANLPDNAMPIASISLKDRAWTWDGEEFIPPCLFVASHEIFSDLLRRFNDVLKSLAEKARAALAGGGREVVSMFWPLIQQLRITADKERELMTPMSLLSYVQKSVSAFACAAELCNAFDMTVIMKYHNYANGPYDYMNAYESIDYGIRLLREDILETVQKLAEQTPQKPIQPEPDKRSPSRPDLPVLADASSIFICKTPKSEMLVNYRNRAATIYYTIDGSDPTQRSLKTNKSSNFKIFFNNGFSGGQAEPNKTITIKLIAVVDGMSSDIASYDVTLKKDRNFSDATPI